MIRGRVTLLVATAAGLVPLVARADPAPRVDLSRCDLFDATAVIGAIAAELGSTPAERLQDLLRVTVTIDCPDLVTAHITVEPSRRGDRLEKGVDLGDLPADLRLRLLALAVAELVDVALTVVAENAAAPPADREPASARDQAANAGGPAEVGRGPPGGEPTAGQPGQGGSALAAARRPRAGDDAGRGRGLARLGVRFFGSEHAPMIDLSVGFARGRLTIDAFVASRQAVDPLGDLRATVGGLGGAVHLGCRGFPGAWLCAGGRAAVGLASISADSAHPLIDANDVLGIYAEAGPRLEARLEYARWSGSFVLDAGWSWGLVGIVEDREVARLSGAVVTASIGVGWGP